MILRHYSLQFFLLLLKSTSVTFEDAFRFSSVKYVTRYPSVLFELVTLPILFSPSVDLLASDEVVTEVRVIFDVLLHGVPIAERSDQRT